MGNLLSVSADYKTRKGEAFGYLTAILYLAPHNVAGLGNVCPNASPECVALCLNTAGRGVFNSVQNGRIRRTREFFADRKAFVATLHVEIAALVRKATREGFAPVVRLNGTSDIGWEAFGIMQAFPGVTFYTKSPIRMRRYLAGKLPANYSLTFLRSECNEPLALEMLANGGNVAVVFSTKRHDALPAAWNGYRVLDGDVSDTRFADDRALLVARDWPRDKTLTQAPGYVVGLRAKGKARRMVGGFVVDAQAPQCRPRNASEWCQANALDRARVNFRRACTIHDREQRKGRRDMSVMQTRRMALAVAATQRAAFKLQDAVRNAGGAK